jgi:hypothetical protein
MMDDGKLERFRNEVGCGLIELLSRHLPNEEAKPRKTSVRIVKSTSRIEVYSVICRARAV